MRDKDGLRNSRNRLDFWKLLTAL